MTGRGTPDNSVSARRHNTLVARPHTPGRMTVESAAAPVPPAPQRRQRRERLRAGVRADRRFEHGARRARVGIDAENKKLGGNGPEIDHALDHLTHCEVLVVDCDIDVIDRSQFPAAPGARAGGMRVEDFFSAVRQLAAHPKVRLIDLVEWDPPLDSTDLSALTAARWVAECLAGYEMR